MQAVKETFEQAIKPYVNSLGSIKYFELEVLGNRFEMRPTAVLKRIMNRIKEKKGEIL